jgi:ribosomal protein S18 acetylase RimI-like enzyme
LDKIHIEKASDFSSKTKIGEHLSTLFVDGFLHNDLDRQWMIVVLQDLCIKDYFYVIMNRTQIIGMASLNPYQLSCLSISDNKMLQTRRGNYIKLYQELMTFNRIPKYPFTIDPDNQGYIGAIEFIVINKNYRGKGYARALVSHILSDNLYTQHILQVEDTNKTAISLYQSLGFKKIFSCNKYLDEINLPFNQWFYMLKN